MNAHDMTLADLIEQAKAIRQGYHKLEEKHHGTPWSVEEDAIAWRSTCRLHCSSFLKAPPAKS